MKSRFFLLAALTFALAGCNSKFIKASDGNCSCSRVSFPSGATESVFCERQPTEESCRQKCASAVVLDVERKSKWFGPNNEKGGCSTRQLDTEGLLTGLAGKLSGKEAEPEKEAPPAKPTFPSITSTPLVDFFRNNPWDGRAQPAYPIVAVTIRDWSDSQCYSATAVIWHNARKSESVPEFRACSDREGASIAQARDNGFRREMFERQIATSNHTGNVRSTGPKPPISGTPRDPMFMNKRGMGEFIANLVTVTGWNFGGGVRFWITGYEPNKAGT